MTLYEQAYDIIDNSMYFAIHADFWEELSTIVQKYRLKYTLKSDGYYHLNIEQPNLNVEAIIADKEKLVCN
jgi:hypothetical protein